MRKIPVIINGNENYIVGFLEIDDRYIPDKDLMDMHVSWLWNSQKKQVMCMSLNPMMSIPKD